MTARSNTKAENVRQKNSLAKGKWARLRKDCYQNRYLLMLMIPSLILIILFKYVPMYGILMAFEKYRPSKGILGSEWVGLYQFKVFLEDP